MTDATQTTLDLAHIRTEGGPLHSAECSPMAGYLASETEWRRAYTAEAPPSAADLVSLTARDHHAQQMVIIQLQVEMEYLRIAAGSAQRQAATAEASLAAVQAFAELDQQDAHEPEPPPPGIPARALRCHKQAIGLLTLWP